MAIDNVTRVGLGTALIAAVGTLAIGFVGIGWTVQSPAESLLPVYVVGPYAVLGLLAWWQRRSRGRSWFILAVILVTAAFGLWAFGVSCYRHHANENWRRAMDMSPLLVPAIQWIASVAVSLLVAILVGLTKTRATTPR